MNAYVLDTSVAIAWYLDESFSRGARAWQQRLLDGEISLVVPSLHYLEFANVLRTLVRRSELDTGLSHEIYDLHLEAPLEVGEPDRRGLLDLALKYGATVYDAAYIDLSLQRDLSLITAERSTTPWVVKLGDRIESVD